MARAKRGSATGKASRWSRQVNETSDALDLGAPDRARLERAKGELRTLFGR